MNWKKLQNGSDIRGVALEGIEGEHVCHIDLSLHFLDHHTAAAYFPEAEIIIDFHKIQNLFPVSIATAVRNIILMSIHSVQLSRYSRSIFRRVSIFSIVAV